MNLDKYTECLFDQDPDLSLRPDKGLRYRTKTIRSGPVVEVEIFPIWPTQAERRKAKARISREAQRNLNARNSRKKLDRMINANFSDQDICVTLTYEGEAPGQQQAMKDIRNYLRRVRDWRRKRGMEELKYIYVVEWDELIDSSRVAENVGEPAADNRTDPQQLSFLEPVSDVKAKRIHHHVILSGMDRDAAEQLWKKGRANSRRLQPDDYGLQALAGYIVKAPRTKKRWYGSRNLVPPRVTVSDHKFSRRQAMLIAEGIADQPAAIFRKKFPAYEMAGCPIVKGSEFVSGLYIYARMIRKE